MAEPRRRAAWRTLAAVGVSGALIGLLLGQIELGGVGDRLWSIDPGALGLAALLSVVVLLLRSLRFIAVTVRSRPGHVMAAVAGQNAINRVAPFKLGELSLPYLLHRASGEPPARSLVLLVIVRLLELWLMCVGLAVAAGLWFGGQEWPQLIVAAAAGLVFTVLLLTFRSWASGALALADRLSGAIGLARWARLDDIWQAVADRLRAAVESTRALSGRQQIALLATTTLVQVAQYALMGCLIASVGVEVQVGQLIIGYTLAQIAGALPVLSVGNVGTHEVGWVAGFVWVGMDLSDAILTGLLTQAVTLAFAALFAAPAAVWFVTRARRPDASPPGGAPAPGPGPVDRHRSTP